MAQERVEDRERVVDPRPGEPERQHEGRTHRAQGLVEVGRVLLGDRMKPRGGNHLSGGFGNRVEVANDRIGHDARRERPICPTIRRYDNRRANQRISKQSFGERCPANHRYTLSCIDNQGFHSDTVTN